MLNRYGRVEYEAHVEQSWYGMGEYEAHVEQVWYGMGEYEAHVEQVWYGRVRGPCRTPDRKVWTQGCSESVWFGLNQLNLASLSFSECPLSNTITALSN